MAKRHDKKKEAARRMREQRAREQRQKQLRWGLGIVVAVLVIGGLIATVMVVSKGYDVHQPKAEATDSALVLSEKGKKPKVKLELYEDFICPACGVFQVGEDRQSGYGPAIQEAVKAGKVELEFHPLNFLAGASTTDYSLRAASAVTCAADEGKFFEYEHQLFVNQPAEGSEGLPDEKLIEFGKDYGKSFEKCVKDKKYYGWVDQLTEAAQEEGIESTPTARIDGKKVESENFEKTFQAALDKAYPEDKKDDKKDKEDKDKKGKD